MPAAQPVKKKKLSEKNFVSKLAVGSEVMAPDNTIWKVAQINETSSGRRGQQNVLKRLTGPVPIC